MPTFWYEDAEGRKRRYYPDIYLPEHRRIIEVKCDAWRVLSRDNNTMRKALAVQQDAGDYQMEIWDYTKHGVCKKLVFPRLLVMSTEAGESESLLS